MDEFTVGCYVRHIEDAYCDNSNCYNVISVNEEAGTLWISNGVITQKAEMDECLRIDLAEAVYNRLMEEWSSYEDSIGVAWLKNLLREHPEVEPTMHRYLQVNVKPEDIVEED